MMREGVVPVATAVAALALLPFLPHGPEPVMVDNPAIRDAGQFALEHEETGSRVAWRNGASGPSGTLTPLKVFRDADGQWRRDYVGRGPGAAGASRHPACREPAAHWRLRRLGPQVAASPAAEHDGPD